MHLKFLDFEFVVLGHYKYRAITTVAISVDSYFCTLSQYLFKLFLNDIAIYFLPTEPYPTYSPAFTV